MEYIITGRSIDGTEYFAGDSCLTAWAGCVHQATRYGTQQEAEALIDGLRKQEQETRDDFQRIYNLHVRIAPPKRYGMWRKEKRQFRNFMPLDACQQAYYEGELDALEGRPARCRYPKGFRRTAYLNGHALHYPAQS